MIKNRLKKLEELSGVSGAKETEQTKTITFSCDDTSGIWRREDNSIITEEEIAVYTTDDTYLVILITWTSKDNLADEIHRSLETAEKKYLNKKG